MKNREIGFLFLKAVQFASNIKLFPEQSRAVEQAIQNDCGVIVAPSGSGKTIIGLALVAQRSLPALILVHRKQLLDQWMERIETSLSIPFKFSTDNFQLLSKIICFDTIRNQLIIKDIQEQVAQGKKVLLLSERRDHLDILNLYLKGLCETIVVSGEDSETKRQIKLKQIENGHFQVILCLFKDCLFCYFSNLFFISYPVVVLCLKYLSKS